MAAQWMYVDDAPPSTWLQDTVVDLANKNCHLTKEREALRWALEAQKENNYKLFLEKEQTITKLLNKITRVSNHLTQLIGYGWSATLVEGQWVILADQVEKTLQVILDDLKGIY